MGPSVSSSCSCRPSGLTSQADTLWGGELGDSHSEQAQGESWKKPPLECEVEYWWPWLGLLWNWGAGGRVFVFALQWVWVRSSCLVVLGAHRDSPHLAPAPPWPHPAGPAHASVVMWNVRSQGDILLIRQTQTGNLYKHKRIHFQKNKLLRGEEERVHFVFLNKYAILLT